MACERKQPVKQLLWQKNLICFSDAFFLEIVCKGKLLYVGVFFWKNCEEKQMFTVRPKKLMFLMHCLHYLQTLRIKNFDCISSIDTEKLSIHHELST